MKYRMILYALALSLVARTSCATTPVNVVIILADDLNTRTFDEMERLNEIAAHGMRFNAIIPSPLCAPSRGATLTGQLNHNNGILNNTVANQNIWRSRIYGHTVAEWMQAAGVHTIGAGKYMNGVGYNELEKSGWDVWLKMDGRGRGGMTKKGVYWVDDLANRTANEILDTPNDQPLFVYFAPASPHGPWTSSPIYNGMYDGEPLREPKNFNEVDLSDKRSEVIDLPLIDDEEFEKIQQRQWDRKEMTHSLEDAIQTLMQAIHTAGRSGTTYFFIYSDNGYFEGEHRRPANKGLPYDEALLVPLIVIGPDVPTGTSNAIVYNHDMAPTAAALIGVTPLDSVDGVSIAPLWRFPGIPWRKRALIEHYGPDHKLLFAGMRTEHRKAVQFEGGRELYDLDKDPYEMNSRCKNNSECGTMLLLRTEEMLTCAGVSCWEMETRE